MGEHVGEQLEGEDGREDRVEEVEQLGGGGGRGVWVEEWASSIAPLMRE